MIKDANGRPIVSFGRTSPINAHVAEFLDRLSFPFSLWTDVLTRWWVRTVQEASTYSTRICSLFSSRIIFEGLAFNITATMRINLLSRIILMFNACWRFPLAQRSETFVWWVYLLMLRRSVYFTTPFASQSHFCHRTADQLLLVADVGGVLMMTRRHQWSTRLLLRRFTMSIRHRTPPNRQ